MKRNRNLEDFHDGWLSLTDILTVLVCGLLFFSVITGGRGQRVHSFVRPLENVEAQIKRIQEKVIKLRSGIGKAEKILEVIQNSEKETVYENHEHKV